MTKEILILRGIGTKYAIHLNFNDMDDLNKVIEALKPLGYTFRFPRR